MGFQQSPEILGQKTMAASQSVVISSDQTSIPVTGTFSSTFTDANYGTPTVLTQRVASMLGVGSTAVSNSNPVPVSDAGSSLTVDGTVAATQSGGWAVTLSSVTRDNGASDASTLRVAVATDSTISAENFPTTADVNLGTPGSSTLRAAAMLGVGSTAVSNANPVPVSDAGGSITVDGTVAATQSGSWTTSLTSVTRDNGASDSSTLRVAVATDSTISAENFPTTVDTNTGAAGASTIRTVLATRHETATTPLATRLSDGTSFYVPPTKGRTRVSNITNDYSSVNVTTGAYVQLIASTSAEINRFHIFDSSGSALIIATGAAASEVDQFYIPPGGIDGAFDFNIASGTRVSIKALDTSATTGRLLLTALS